MVKLNTSHQHRAELEDTDRGWGWWMQRMGMVGWHKRKERGMNRWVNHVLFNTFTSSRGSV